MFKKRAFLLSICFHLFLFCSLMKFQLFKQNPKKTLMAQLVFKGDMAKKNQLPKKNLNSSKNEPLLLPISQKSKSSPPKKNPPKKEIKKNSSDYNKLLKNLSSDFINDINSYKDSDNDIEKNGDYFDQIYTLIKNSFVLPKSLEEKEKNNLNNIVKIFLKENGQLLNAILEKSSGNEIFDKLVIEGILRIKSFGQVPSSLITYFKEQGLSVKMCPYECQED